MAKLSTILDQIDAGTMLLPEFQRGYVWNRDQVRGLMRSLYRATRWGRCCVWETEGSGQAVRGRAATAARSTLLLDGQQRVTTLYGIVRGRPPAFFEGDPEAFTDLRFNLETEQFEFHAPGQDAGRPALDRRHRAVPSRGAAAVLAQLLDLNWAAPQADDYLSRISRLTSVLERDFHIERSPARTRPSTSSSTSSTGSTPGGTKLSKGDLALARICAEWPRRPSGDAAQSRPLERGVGTSSPRLAPAQRQRRGDGSRAVLRARRRVRRRRSATH